jgi:cell division protein FtsL
MKKSTLVIWAIIFGILALLIFENQEFFLAKQSLRINLWVKEYKLPELANALLILIIFLAGIVITFLFTLSARFRARRTIKKLNATVTKNNKELSELKTEINSLKGIENPSDTGGADTGNDLPATQTMPVGSFKSETGTTEEALPGTEAENTEEKNSNR